MTIPDIRSHMQSLLLDMLDRQIQHDFNKLGVAASEFPRFRKLVWEELSRTLLAMNQLPN